MQNPLLLNSIKDGTLLPQVVHGGIGTRPNAGGAHEFNSFFCKKNVCCCQVQLSVPAMQVTSSHVSIWYDFLASYDEYTALVKFGNVASEHVKSAISVVQPQLSAAQQKPSAVQQNRVGALVTHHPAWMSHHTGGSRQGHPRYTGAQQWEGRGWPDQEISQSAAHRHTKCKSCLTAL